MKILVRNYYGDNEEYPIYECIKDIFKGSFDHNGTLEKLETKIDSIEDFIINLTMTLVHKEIITLESIASWAGYPVGVKEINKKMGIVLCKICGRFIDTDKDVWHGWEHALPCPSAYCEDGYRTDDVADGDDGFPTRAKCPECEGEGCIEPDWA